MKLIIMPPYGVIVRIGSELIHTTLRTQSGTKSSILVVTTIVRKTECLKYNLIQFEQTQIETLKWHGYTKCSESVSFPWFSYMLNGREGSVTKEAL